MDVTAVIREILSRNLGPDPYSPGKRVTPDYGVEASLEGQDLAVVLRFLSGCHYCCMEWGCHLPIFDGKRWDRVRETFDAHKITIPTQLQLHLTAVVESGALFFDLSKPDPNCRLWYAFSIANAYEYQVSSLEAPLR